ncbi:armadillo-type protein, partial [Ganoderma leucocontextum]
PAALQASPENLYCEVSTLLDNLSKDSLPSVSDNTIAWANRSREETDGHTLSRVVGLVFEKANENAARSGLYAELCRRMMEGIDPEVHDCWMMDVEGELLPGPRVFRKYLIDRCQEEFMRGLGAEGASSVDDQRSTQQYLGLVKFLGELFNMKMLTQGIMYECLNTLITNFESTGEPDLYLECLEVLLTTVGRLLNSSKARAHLDVYFSRIQGLSRNSAVTPLHRQRLQSFLNLRTGWKAGQEAHLTTVKDDSIGGHALGDWNVSLHKKSQQPSGALQSTSSPATKSLDRWTRLVSLSTESEELTALLFGTAVSADQVQPSPSSPAPSVSNSATTALVPDPPADANGVVDDEASKPVSPSTVYSLDPQSSDDGLYADFTESRAIPSSHITPAPAPSQQRRINSQQASNQHISPRATNHHHVEERIPEPPTPPLSDSNDLPLVRLRMSQKEANEHIEQTVALLFGGPHDIDSALSVFAVMPPRHHSRLIDRLVSFAIESTRADAQLVAYFFYCAAAKGLCSAAAFEAGFALTAAALEDVAAESPDAVLLFASMAKGAGLHRDREWRRRFFGRLEVLGYGPDLASLSS